MAEPSDPSRLSRWDSTDAENLKTFLHSQSGRRFIRRLRGDRIVLVLSDYQQAALTGAAVSGYEYAIENIFDYLVIEADSHIPSPYPSLDDDVQWTSDEVPNEAEPPTKPQPSA